MKVAFLDTPEDMCWLFDTALKPANINTRDGDVPKGWQHISALVYGNEDAPDRIECFSQQMPLDTSPCVVYVMNDEGKYDETYFPSPTVYQR